MTGYFYRHDYLGADANVSSDLGRAGDSSEGQGRSGGNYSDDVMNCGDTGANPISSRVNLGQQYGQSIENCGAIGTGVHGVRDCHKRDQPPSKDFNPYTMPNGSGLLKRDLS